MTEKFLKDVVTEYMQRCRFRIMKYFYSIKNDVPSDPPSWNEYKVRPNVTSSEINVNLIENQQISGPTLLSTLGRENAASSSDAVRSDRVDYGMSSSSRSNVTSHPKRQSKSERSEMKSKEKKGRPMSRELHNHRSTKADLTLNVSSSAPLRKKCTSDDVRNDYIVFSGDEDNSMLTSHIVTASFSGNSSTVLTRKTVDRSNNTMLHDRVLSRRPSSTVRVRRRPSQNNDRSSNHIKPKLSRVEKRKTEMVEKSAPEKKPKLQTNALEGPDKKTKLRRDYRKESREENQKLVEIGRESPLPNNKKKQKSNAKEKESSPHHPDKLAKLVHHNAHIKGEQRRDKTYKEKKTYKLHPIAGPRQGGRGNKRKSAVHYLSQRNEKQLFHSPITPANRGKDSITTSEKKLKIQRKVFITNSGVKKQKTLGTIRRSSPPHLNQQAMEDHHSFTPVPKTQIQPALKAVGRYRKISGHHSKASPRQDIGEKEIKTCRMEKNTRHHKKLQAHKAMPSSQDVEETQITTPIWKSVIKKRTEKWEELYKDPIQHAGDILTIPIEFRKQFKDEFEKKLIDQKADLNNLLPKDTIKLILNKYNAINNKRQSKLQTQKDIQHLLDMECSNYQNKPTSSKDFWKVSEHRVDFMPPEICPEHLHATKTQFFEYTELVKRVKEKKFQMAEEIGGLEKVVGLQALITEAKETVEKGWTEMDSHTKSLLLQNACGMKADVDELLKSLKK